MLNLLKSRKSRQSLLESLSIRSRVFVWICLLAVVVGVAGYSGFRKLHAQITSDATQAATLEMQNVQDLLDLSRRLYLEQVRASIEILKRDTLQLGAPHLVDPVKVGEATVPNLDFGTTPMADNRPIVDSVQHMMGGTTGLFVRQGDTFIRIDTNVLDTHGQRALGTEIDAHGQAVVALRQGKVYAGVINILGSPYIGEDDPIIDDHGQVIGVWFVGFKIENLSVLMSRINSSRILENGFIALFDAQNNLIAQSANAQPKIVETLCLQADRSPDPDILINEYPWQIRKQTFAPWGYGIVSATYLPDLVWRAVNGVWLIFSVVGIIAFGALLAQGAALVRSRQMMDEAEKARLSAEEASRTKSAFLANMSHELRTPLNAIIGYSEMLVEDAIDRGQEEMEPDLRKIQGSGKHLLSLINDILDLSKIEAGKMTFYLEEFDVPNMVREVASTIQPLLVKNGNHLEIDCPEEVGSICADVTKTRQILFNLLSNASKFTNNGKVLLKCTRDAKEIHFSVQDTGVGMSAETQKKLFKEFSQADDTSTRKYGGTGLGLAISKRFCEMMGGSIRLESQSGVGTTFYVNLPIKAIVDSAVGVEIRDANPTDGQAEISTPKTVTPAAGAEKPGVLVIDDDAEVRNLMQRVLEKEGYAMHLTASGQDALALAKQVKPCLVFLDIMMPGVDGWTVLAALKNDPETRDTPVIVVTSVDNKPMALALGATDYVAKPFDREKILELSHQYAPITTPHVLIIEDDINSYEVLGRILEKEGIKVSYAPNGRIALDMVEEVLPSLIILDLMMPEMNGFDFITELRRRKTGVAIPVVVLSGRDLTSPERNLLNQTAQKTILKGALSAHDLIEEIRRYLPVKTAPPKP